MLTFQDEKRVKKIVKEEITPMRFVGIQRVSVEKPQLV